MSETPCGPPAHWRSCPLGPKSAPSGIRKVPVASAELGLTGFTGDEQGDLKHHGGTEKAVHQYCLDHYPCWRQELSDLAILDQPGAFGENLAVSGLDETSVCVGDTSPARPPLQPLM